MIVNTQQFETEHKERPDRVSFCSRHLLITVSTSCFNDLHVHLITTHKSISEPVSYDE